ncbi:hypothetical protein TB2_040189 [Malus domestica]
MKILFDQLGLFPGCLTHLGLSLKRAPFRESHCELASLYRFPNLRTPKLQQALKPLLILFILCDILKSFLQNKPFYNIREARRAFFACLSAFFPLLVQEVVDTLLDNGIRRQPMRDDHNKVYKSFSDVIEGKKGRFHETLLGKRVDYSGHSVIVVGPFAHSPLFNSQ